MGTGVGFPHVVLDAVLLVLLVVDAVLVEPRAMRAVEGPMCLQRTGRTEANPTGRTDQRHWPGWFNRHRLLSVRWQHKQSTSGYCWKYIWHFLIDGSKKQKNNNNKLDIRNNDAKLLPFCKPAGSGGAEFGGETFSGLMVRAATAAGLSAGSVARLAFSLNLGTALSSSLIFLLSATLSSDLRDSLSESRLLSRFLPTIDDLDEPSSSLTIESSSSASLRLGLLVASRDLDDAFFSRSPRA